MIRRIVTPVALITLMAVSACRGGSEATPAAPLVTHDAFVTSLNGAYIWNCTMTNEAGNGQWQFVLSKSNSSRWTDIILQEAGARYAEDIETRKFGAAVVYTLRDRSKVLIADDGEARGEGQQSTKPHDFPQGQCQRGNEA